MSKEGVVRRTIRNRAVVRLLEVAVCRERVRYASMRGLCELFVYGVVESLTTLVLRMSSRKNGAYGARECRVGLGRPSSDKVNWECLRGCETCAE
jgi:hypothetical protein